MTRDETFAVIFRDCYGVIWRYFKSKGLSDIDARDLTEDTFQLFYERMDRQRGRHPLPYIRSIARSVVVNWARRARAIKRSALETSVEDPELFFDPAAPEDREDEAAAEQRRALLRQRMNALPKDLQECVRLRVMGLKYKEIAKVLRVSVDVVESRLRDAKKLLGLSIGDES